MADKVDVAVIGSGPAGLSAGGRAAALGMSHVVLERCDIYADTIQKYQRGKFVMATPDVLDLRSDMSFVASSRENILDTWGEEIKSVGVQVRYGTEVTGVKGAKGAFTLTLRDGSTLGASNVVLGIGVQGNLRKLTIPGAELPFITYQLDDPEEFEGQNIVVIGAGDSAIENVLALSINNQVTIVNRRGEFARAKTGNLLAIERAIASGRVDCAYNSSPQRARPGVLELRTPTGTREIPCDLVIARLGADPPRRFLESCGIKFPKGAMYPEISTSYETNVPGLYAIGALAGYPLIKHCMNQGYEVLQTIAGSPVPPADEPLLVDKLIGMPVKGRVMGKEGGPQVDDAIEEIKKRIPLFNGLTTLQLREFMIDSDTHVLLAGEVVFERNDFSNTLYCVLSGEVEVEIPDQEDPEAQPRVFVRRGGDFFGEQGLIAGRRRPGQARAKTDCVLTELGRRSAVKLLNSDPAARELFERTTIVRQLQEDLLPDLSEEDLVGVLASAEIQKHPAGTNLIVQGDDDDQSVYMIRSGSVTVSRQVEGKEVVLSYLPAGHIVGEMALLEQAHRSATVRAAIEVEVVRIDGVAFRRLMEQRPTLRTKLEEVRNRRLARQASREADTTSGSIVSGLMASGVGEATDVLLIDESLCIRCDNCEKACAESHDGITRLDREAGPTYAMIHVPTSCRHCEHPHCMLDCPPDAIHRAATGEVWIDDTCIGCNNCAVNCPYGVIQMAVPPPKKPSLLQWLMFGSGPGPGGYRNYKASAADGVDPSKKKAVKCDMCKDIDGGPACVRACPTGAAIRVHPSDFFDAIHGKS